MVRYYCDTLYDFCHLWSAVSLRLKFSMPWSRGQCFVWYFTWPDTFAVSYLNWAVLDARTVASDDESKKQATVWGFSDMRTLKKT